MTRKNTQRHNATHNRHTVIPTHKYTATATHSVEYTLVPNFLHCTKPQVPLPKEQHRGGLGRSWPQTLGLRAGLKKLERE